MAPVSSSHIRIGADIQVVYHRRAAPALSDLPEDFRMAVQLLRTALDLPEHAATLARLRDDPAIRDKSGWYATLSAVFQEVYGISRLPRDWEYLADADRIALEKAGWTEKIHEALRGFQHATGGPHITRPDPRVSQALHHFLSCRASECRACERP